MNENRFFTTRELAEILKLAPKTIIKNIMNGKIKGVKFGKGWRITGKEYDRILKEGW